jgi:hypothetical protein
MSSNHRKILEMLADKKIGVDEAYKLLSLIAPETAGEARDTGEKRSSAKYLRVTIKSKSADSNDGRPEHVNVRVPMTLIRAGVKLTSLIPPSAYDKVESTLKEKGIDFDLRNIKPEDIEELVLALSDLEVDIQNGDETVRVYVE